MTGLLPTLLVAALLAGPAVGTPLPWFAGWDAEDRVINRTMVLQEPADGRVVVLFATWCAPCEKGLAAMRGARGGLLKGADVTLVACGESPDVVQPWLAARGWGDARVIYDRFGTIARDLGVEQRGAGKRTMTLPRVVVADRAGVVRAVLDGSAAHDVRRIAAALSASAGAEQVRSPAAP